MRTIVAGTIIVYSLPLLLLWWATIETAFYEGVALPNGTVATSAALYVTVGIAEDVLGTLRDMFGSILMPLVAAYAISTPKAGEEVPRMTQLLFVAFLILFISSIVQVGLINAKETKIESLDIEGYQVQNLYQMARSFTTESLTYAALLLGITIKKRDA